MYARALTWWIILRIALEERLVYRGDFAMGTLMRFLPIVTQIFLWSAIFLSIGGGEIQAETTIAGYRFEDMVAYYLLTMVARAFSSMPGLASGVARQVREGEVKKFLVQPVDMLGFLLLTRVAHKLAYYVVATIPFAIVFFLCRSYFVNGWPDAPTMVAFICSLIMAFFLGFFLEASIGLISFWFLEVTSLLFLYMLFSFFLSGHMFPLDMLPEPWNLLVDALPLKYFAFFPAAVFLGKVTGWELVKGLCMQAAWVLFFIVLSRVLWRAASSDTAAMVVEGQALSDRPSYYRVFLTFARNSLVRNMTFRANFVLECVSSMSWTVMNLGFYLIVFYHLRGGSIGVGTGWGQYEFFVFIATTWLVNSLVQAFFMPNAQEFSELIRTGNLDFALVKPIDTQFLISFTKVEWSSLSNFFVGILLLVLALGNLTTRAEQPLVLTPINFVLYAVYILCGVAIMYSVMISLAATSIWLGRNQTLYNFWFYITNFSRYPMEIYQRGVLGWSLWGLFTFVVPVLIVINVPARLLAQPLNPREWWEWPLAGFAILATLWCLLASRWIFRRALLSYRSASS